MIGRPTRPVDPFAVAFASAAGMMTGTRSIT